MHEEPKLLCMKMQIQNLFLRVVPFQPKTKETKKDLWMLCGVLTREKIFRATRSRATRVSRPPPRPTNSKAVYGVFSLCKQMKYFPVEIGIQNKYEWDLKIQEVAHQRITLHVTQITVILTLSNQVEIWYVASYA